MNRIRRKPNAESGADPLEDLLARAAVLAADCDGPGHPGGAVALRHSVVVGPKTCWIAEASWADNREAVVVSPAEEAQDAVYGLIDLLEAFHKAGWASVTPRSTPVPDQSATLAATDAHDLMGLVVDDLSRRKVGAFLVRQLANRCVLWLAENGHLCYLRELTVSCLGTERDVADGEYAVAATAAQTARLVAGAGAVVVEGQHAEVDA